MNFREISYFRQNGEPRFAQTFIKLETRTLVQCPGKSKKEARKNLILECVRRLKIHGEKKRRNRAYQKELKAELERWNAFEHQPQSRGRQRQNWIPRPIKEGRVEITFELIDNINIKRRKLGWGIPKLSRESGIPQGTLTSILSMTVSSTDKKNLKGILDALKNGNLDQPEEK